MTTLAPPAIGSTYVTAKAGDFMLGDQRIVMPGVGFDASAIWGLINNNQIDPKQQAVYSTEADWLERLGVKFVRILGLDACNIRPIFLPGSTLKIDPVKAAALKWWLNQLGQRGIRYLIPLHYKRFLTAADLGQSSSPLALECVSTNWTGHAGESPPWDLFDTQTLQPLQFGFDAAIAQIVADDPACVGYELENENQVVKASQWSFSPTTKPKLEAARQAAWNAWAGANGVTQQNSRDTFRFWADMETAYMQARIANLKQYAPHALFTGNTWFGDGAYPMLASSITVGNFVSGHVYTGNQPTDPPGFYNGRVGVTPPDPGTRLTAVCRGLKWQNSSGELLPSIVSEFGPQYQSPNNPPDAKQYIAGDLMTAAWQMARTNTNGFCLYSWAESAIWAGGKSAKSGPYDLRNCPEIVEALPAAISVFCNPNYRPAASTPVVPTYGLYGTNVPGGKFTIYGPITDPASYAA